MIVKSVVNEDALKAMGIRGIGNRKALFVLAAEVLIALYAVFLFFLGVYGGVAFAVLLDAALAVYVINVRSRIIKLTLNRLEESMGSREAVVLIDFSGKDTFRIQNLAADKQTEMKIAFLEKLKEKNGYAYLWTKAAQCFIFPLDQFEGDAQKQQFYELLKSLAPHMKIKVK